MSVEAHMKKFLTVQRQRQVILNSNEMADPTTQTILDTVAKSCHIEPGGTNRFETCTN